MDLKSIVCLTSPARNAAFSLRTARVRFSLSLSQINCLYLLCSRILFFKEEPMQPQSPVRPEVLCFICFSLIPSPKWPLSKAAVPRSFPGSTWGRKAPEPRRAPAGSSEAPRGAPSSGGHRCCEPGAAEPPAPSPALPSTSEVELRDKRVSEQAHV